MPKRLTLGLILITLALSQMVPLFVKDILAMDLTGFHYLLVGSYALMVLLFYYVALVDLKDRWK
jgi:hypothetical protein